VVQLGVDYQGGTQGTTCPYLVVAYSVLKPLGAWKQRIMILAYDIITKAITELVLDRSIWAMRYKDAAIDISNCALR